MRALFSWLLIATCCAVHGQDAATRKLESWIAENKVPMNEPVGPQGFEAYVDCALRPAYRQQRGDTIILYTWNGSIAEDLNTFKKTVTSPDFNVKRYPSYVQDNATVVVTKLAERRFIWRNDTLYLYDSYNEELAKRHMALMDEFLPDDWGGAEYDRRRKEIDAMDFGFVPQYKAIYFKGIFDRLPKHRFSSDRNFREETVQLNATWMEGDQRYYEILLKTHTAGEYRFSEDMGLLETTNCR